MIRLAELRGFKEPYIHSYRSLRGIYHALHVSFWIHYQRITWKSRLLYLWLYCSSTPRPNRKHQMQLCCKEKPELSALLLDSKQSSIGE